MKRSIIVLALLFSIGIVNNSAQEALKSAGEEYYDFLSLQGLAERPYLNYRTLSDSVWTIEEGASHPWQGQNLGMKRQLFGDVFMRIYGPELFTSFNTAAPYGQNDGALWQGRGFNSSLTGGVRFEGYGVELTLKPQLAFSQNAAFDIMPSNYDSKYGYFWGYGHNVGVDAPQRFGDKPFFTYDWGDTEIRYTWKTLTIGFGTQAIWLGPAYLNPMLHSNNAPTYPKFDIGLRKQRVTLPWLDWYIGDVEARLWTGYLSESDYFDNDDSNDHTMFHGLAFAYAPSFLPGLTLFVNRVCLVPWELENLKYIIPIDANTYEDQKASFGVSWLLPAAGVEIYGELGIDDFNAHDESYIFHTMVYTGGLRKDVKLFSDKLRGELIFEWSNYEMSQDFQFQWPYTFYFHHQLTQGYTNKGQLIGNGIGVGGDSQYLGFKVYYPRGHGLLYLYRVNPDSNYLFSKAVNSTHSGTAPEFYTFNATLSIGADFLHYITKSINIGGGFVYHHIYHQNYEMIRGRYGVSFMLKTQMFF